MSDSKPTKKTRAPFVTYDPETDECLEVEIAELHSYGGEVLSKCRTVAGLDRCQRKWRGAHYRVVPGRLTGRTVPFADILQSEGERDMDPQTTIANLCQIALDLVPNDDLIVAARELARRGILTTDAFVQLRSHVALLAGRGDGELGPIWRELAALSDPDDVPVTVAELRDEDNQPVWRVTSAAGTVLYAWVDARGWESTGWVLGSFLDDVPPVPGYEDLPRGAWPVGLAQLAAKALAEIKSEPDTWGEP